MGPHMLRWGQPCCCSQSWGKKSGTRTGPGLSSSLSHVWELDLTHVHRRRPGCADLFSRTGSGEKCVPKLTVNAKNKRIKLHSAKKTSENMCLKPQVMCDWLIWLISRVGNTIVMILRLSQSMNWWLILQLQRVPFEFCSLNLHSCANPEVKGRKSVRR